MKALFAGIADQFDLKIQESNVTSTTEIVLTTICVDQQGNEIKTSCSIVPLTTIGGFGAIGKEIAHKSHVGDILGNINSLVRNAPTDWVMMRDAPQIPLKITGFALSITP
jgi:hypothetical protein